MPSLRLPQGAKLDPRVVPTVPFEVDPNHPLSQGLVYAVIPGSMYGLRDVATTGLILTNNAATSVTNTGGGPLLNQGSTVASATYIPASLQLQVGTVSWFGKLTGTLSGQASLFQVYSHANQGPPYTSLGLSLNGGTVTDFVFNGALSSTQNSYWIGSKDVTAMKSSIIVPFNFATNSHTLYVDAVADTSAGGSFAAGTSIYYSDSFLSLGAGSTTMLTQSRMALIHNRALSPNEVGTLNAEPFGMFRKINRKFYVATRNTYAVAATEAGNATHTSTTTAKFAGGNSESGNASDTASATGGYTPVVFGGVARRARIDPRVVPTTPFTIDWTHPLAQGLVSLVIPGSVFGNNDVVSGIALSQVGSSSVVSTSGGPALSQGSSYLNSAATGVPKSLQLQTGTFSYFGAVTTTGSSNYPNLWMIAANQGAVTSPYISTGLNINSPTPQFLFAMVNSGGNHAYAIGTALASTMKNSVVATFNIPVGASGYAIYVDGVADILSDTSSTTAAPTTYYSTGNLYLGSGDPGTSQTTRAAMIHNRVLSASEAAWLNREPFAFLKPTSKRYFAGTLNVSGTLAASSRKASASVSAKQSAAMSVAATTRKPSAAFVGYQTVTGTLSAGTRKAAAAFVGVQSIAGTLAAQTRKAVAAFNGLQKTTGTIATSTRKAGAAIVGFIGTTGSINAATRRASAQIAASQATAMGIAAQTKRAGAAISATQSVVGSLVGVTGKPVAAITASEGTTDAMFAVTRKPSAAISMRVGTAMSLNGNTHKSAASMTGTEATLLSLTAQTSKPASAMSGRQSSVGLINATTRKASAQINAAQAVTASMAGSTHKSSASIAAVEAVAMSLTATTKKPTALMLSNGSVLGSISAQTKKLAAQVNAAQATLALLGGVTKKSAAAVNAKQFIAMSINAQTRRPAASISASEGTTDAMFGVTPRAAASIVASQSTVGSITARGRNPSAAMTARQSAKGVAAVATPPASSLILASIGAGLTVAATTKRAVASIVGVHGVAGTMAAAGHPAVSAIQAAQSTRAALLASTVASSAAAHGVEAVPMMVSSHTRRGRATIHGAQSVVGTLSVTTGAASAVVYERQEVVGAIGAVTLPPSALIVAKHHKPYGDLPADARNIVSLASPNRGLNIGGVCRHISVARSRRGVA